MHFLKKHLTLLMRLSLAVCYIWFGSLKFFEAMSPAESLAKNTIDHLIFGFLPAHISIIILAGWEVLIGLGLLLNRYLRIIVGSALVHMACTFTPFIFSPEICFNHPPFGFSIVGQYIVKNLVFISALIYLYPEKEV